MKAIFVILIIALSTAEEDAVKDALAVDQTTLLAAFQTAHTAFEAAKVDVEYAKNIVKVAGQNATSEQIAEITAALIVLKDSEVDRTSAYSAYMNVKNNAETAVNALAP